MDSLIITLTALTLAAAIAAAWFGFVANRRQAERSDVEWQVTRESQGVFAVVNSGTDAAHDVVVEVWDRHDLVTEKRKRMQPRDEVVTVTLPTRAADGPDATNVPRPITLGLPEPPPEFGLTDSRAQIRDSYKRAVESEQSRQVNVKIVWRSRRHNWAAYTTETG